MVLMTTDPSRDNELNSEEVQELLSFRPHWIIRNGNAILFLILFLLLGATFFIKYPDVIRGSMKLVAVNAPKILVAKVEGKLQKLLVYNEQEVVQGQVLAYIQSTASHRQMLDLQNWINKIEPFVNNDSLKLLLLNQPPLFDELGEVQPAYRDFKTTLNETLQILANGFYVVGQRQKFHSAFFTLKSRIAGWIHRYIVIAPGNGRVLFTSFLQENQWLVNGQELFYVQPPQSLYYGQMMVSQTGLGKIKPGQKVLIRVESYPSNEFGYLTGMVNDISSIPTEKDSFLIKVSLPKGLRTNYDKTIYFRYNLMAGAEVITDNRKLFDRFLGQMKDLTRR